MNTKFTMKVNYEIESVRISCALSYCVLLLAYYLLTQQMKNSYLAIIKNTFVGLTEGNLPQSKISV